MKDAVALDQETDDKQRRLHYDLGGHYINRRHANEKLDPQVGKHRVCGH